MREMKKEGSTCSCFWGRCVQSLYGGIIVSLTLGYRVRPYLKTKTYIFYSYSCSLGRQRVAPYISSRKVLGPSWGWVGVHDALEVT